ncbi:ribosomal-protein-alanine N-acetyltransferase [Sulfurimonas aquatica]|uniref:[Ribosomal protein bS18]-alanine N-acetyltransferase n=1 Tax=Sulfurimonas aquatica TaxID=2672570 RepID=A0A975AZJ6_9BACT|nr:ribosomal protein S18-alanine N-acetyltransferase [Sulfurimonas aquatica]QSZ41476.1 ribosomal-protein-alanine N-acetyltransferase [Sulfurimonas aquatica]
MTISKATIKELSQLYLLENSLFQKENFPLSKASLRYHINNNLIYLAKIEDVVVAYILVLIKRKNAKIHSLGVQKEHRGKNIAKLLLKKALEELEMSSFKSILLEVRCDNQSAISLYKSFQFETTKIEHRFYLDGCDAFIMKKDNGI